ncbi:MAG: (Fe-S)-binding protein [Gammaproteobacteria bacterium]|jgi:Fe-S oxidoreductase|nr:(Fe-S)-binding protein [Gammaproteobacteria bacterium]MBT3725435.1 (Fe-S)-binding protein [Gammaproteobacteria bacterium]MBT4078035.1 (Fe-S)-binding protein [Gammaproteobacteria bacterium]MBT4195736.1 (Fe-S)-binding protein [Gammaproteobacteria bacterium]MBT4449294.1 (Fe-S)-binding protein [Gammaproteobacteria bacterium]
MSERLERGLQALRAEVDAKVKTFFSSCVHCGICAESCLFFTETGDPRYTPIYKTLPLRKIWKEEYTFWGKLSKSLGLTQSLTEDDLKNWEPLVYDGCTLCGRCSMVCPMGIDIASIIQKVKVGLATADYSPNDLVQATQRAVELGSPMGIKLPALKAQIKHVEDDIGLTVPMDIEGAEYMALLSSMEIINFPEYLESLTRIFHQAGVSWTLCSDAFEATNSGLQIGNNAIAAQLVERVVAGAEKLKVKSVISPECGHAYAAIRWNGPNYIGRPYSFKVIHILELLDELKQSGRLKTKGKDNTRLTFHDPCQIVRRGGVEAQPHQLLGSVAENFVEMTENGHMNWCCGGGGGVSSIERAEGLRVKVFSRKKSQLDELNVDKIVTACANCRLVMEEGLEENDMDIPIVGLTEVIAEQLDESNS